MPVIIFTIRVCGLVIISVGSVGLSVQAIAFEPLSLGTFQYADTSCSYFGHI